MKVILNSDRLLAEHNEDRRDSEELNVYAESMNRNYDKNKKNREDYNYNPYDYSYNY